MFDYMGLQGLQALGQFGQAQQAQTQQGNYQGDAMSRFDNVPYHPLLSSRDKTFKEELQDEIDEWLKDI
jgi:hypothetical protein